jgi:cytochrome P450
MRIEPPVFSSNPQCATEDIIIGSGEKAFNLKKGQPFFLSINEIHHHPDVW